MMGRQPTRVCALTWLWLVFYSCEGFHIPLHHRHPTCSSCSFLVAPPHHSSRQTAAVTKCFANRGYNDYEDAAARRRRRQQRRSTNNTPRPSGAAETATGAILGGLLLGPFGALFGADIGARVGSARAAEQAKKEELKRLGLNEDMLQMAEETGAALDRAMEGLKATQESLQSQQSYARRLDEQVTQLYTQAQSALQNDQDEELARKLLLEKQTQTERLKKALKQCASEKQRLEIMEENVRKMEERAMEVDGLLRRSMSAKALQDTADADLYAGMDVYGGGRFALEENDPLLRKFRELEGKD